MDKKAIQQNVVGGIILSVIVAGTTWLVTRVDEGGEAIDKLERQAEMTAAIEKALMTPEGESYGAVLSRIDKDVAVLMRTMPPLLGIPAEPEETPTQ